MLVQTLQDCALNQWNVRYDEHSNDVGHSPKTSGHSLRFWHFHKHSSLLFIAVTSATQPTKPF